jgi:hypothetical protein
VTQKKRRSRPGERRRAEAVQERRADYALELLWGLTPGCDLPPELPRPRERWDRLVWFDQCAAPGFADDFEAAWREQAGNARAALARRDPREAKLFGTLVEFALAHYKHRGFRMTLRPTSPPPVRPATSEGSTGPG